MRVAFSGERLAKDRKRPTVIKVTTSLKSIVSEAVRRGLAATNPVREVRLPGSSRDEEPAEFPAADEIKLLLEGATGDRRPLIHTFIFTGMRPSAIRGLTWENIDFKEVVIHVRQRADRLNQLSRPKSKAGRRSIRMGPHLLALLREWKLNPRSKGSTGWYSLTARAASRIIPASTGASGRSPSIVDPLVLFLSPRRLRRAPESGCNLVEPHAGPRELIAEIGAGPSDLRSDAGLVIGKAPKEAEPVLPDGNGQLALQSFAIGMPLEDLASDLPKSWIPTSNRLGDHLCMGFTPGSICAKELGVGRHLDQLMKAHLEDLPAESS